MKQPLIKRIVMAADFRDARNSRLCESTQLSALLVRDVVGGPASYPP
jgi:hypothetical protein